MTPHAAIGDRCRRPNWQAVVRTLLGFVVAALGVTSALAPNWPKQM